MNRPREPVTARMSPKRGVSPEPVGAAIQPNGGWSCPAQAKTVPRD